MRVNPSPLPAPEIAGFALDASICYLNHGSFGACPRAVLAEQSALRERLERDPIDFMLRELPGRREAARSVVAAFVGVAPDDLVFVSSATAGVNGVLRSLELAAGDEILVTDHGYGACTAAARAMAERAGARVRVATLPFPFADPSELTAAIVAAAGPRTRLAIVDHVTSPTGLVLPVEDIVRVLLERGVETLVDGAHAPGMLKLEIANLGALAYTGNLHKWPGAPKGSAFLWARRDAQRWIRPAVISHGSPDPSMRFQAEHDWLGTADPTPVLSAPTAIAAIGALSHGGWPAIRAENHARAVLGRRLLLNRLGGTAPCPATQLGSLAIVRLPDSPYPAPGPNRADPTQEALWSSFRIEVPIIRWPDSKTRWVRIAMHAYNRLEQIAYLADSLEVVLQAEAARAG